MSGAVTGVVAFASWTAEVGAPRVELIPARQRGRTSKLTRMAAHVLGEIVGQTGVDPSKLATVYATSHGEIGVTVELLSMMHEGDGALSPMRFAGSVYNAAAGHLSIATGSRAFSTTVTAGPRTVAMGLLEAMAVLARIADEVAFIVVEEAVPAPLVSGPGHDGLAAAFLLGTSPATPWTLERLALRTDAPSGASGIPASVAGNPCGPALALASAMRHGTSGCVALERGDDDRRRARWCVDVRPRGGPSAGDGGA